MKAVSSPNPPVADCTVDDEESLVNAIAYSVAAVSGSSTNDLPPVYDSVDTDALQAFLDSLESDGHVVFSYHDYEVAVYPDRTIEIYE